MLERRSHRGRVRVVRVVDQQAAAGEWRLLAAPARELDVHPPGRERQAESLHREQRRYGVLRLVPCRERELELEPLAVEPEDDSAAAGCAPERLDVLGAE